VQPQTSNTQGQPIRYSILKFKLGVEEGKKLGHLFSYIKYEQIKN